MGAEHEFDEEVRWNGWPQVKNWSTNEDEDETFSRVETQCQEVLYQCPLCYALVKDDWDADEKHKDWHMEARH